MAASCQSIRATCGIAWRCVRSLSDFDIRADFLLVFNDGEGRRYVARPITVLEALPDTTPADPTFSLPKRAAQALFDTMYEQGFRPTRREQEIGALQSTRAHLEDMRKIAFKFIEGSAP